VTRGEVFRAHLDPTRGSEQSGLRPVVVVSRNAINRSSPVVIVVPCTSWTPHRRLYPSQVLIRAPEGGLTADSVALCEQVRAVVKDRLTDRWGRLGATTMNRVDRALAIALDLPGQYAPVDL
jgi:mRNA interferase MazF